MRLALLTILTTISSLVYSQLQVEEIPLEPIQSDSSVYSFQEKYRDYLSMKETPIILYFCPIRHYSKQDYSEKITVLKNSPFLKNIEKEVKMYVYYFRENEINDRSGVQVKKDSWVNESTCFFLHFNQQNIDRLAENFPREFKVESTEDIASNRIILFDANRCFPDVPTRLVAYARAIQECLQPNYSESEINKFQKREIEDLKIFKKEVDKSIDEINRTNGKQEEQLFNLKEQSNETNSHLEQMQDQLSQADILLQPYFSLGENHIKNTVAITDAIGSGFFVGTRLRINTKNKKTGVIFLTSGVSIGSQRANFSRDSLLIETNEEDVNGTSYLKRYYYHDVKQRINVSNMAIPLSIQYHYKSSEKSNWKLIVEVGFQLQFQQSFQSQITDGTLSTAGVYAGFNKEIRNVNELGFTDNQSLITENNSTVWKNNNHSGFLGLQFECRINTLLHLNFHARAFKSGSWLQDTPSSSAFEPISGVDFYGQNPYQFGLGLTYSLNQ
jgi:hypothetical protein